MCAVSLWAEVFYDLDLYLAKRRLEGRTKGASEIKFERGFFPSLEPGYVAKYRKAENCTAGAAEMTNDMVERFRKDPKSGAK